MLQNIDINTLNRLTEENKDVQQIFSQLIENHHMLLSTIAHEIRNPLTLISSSIQTIEMQHPEVQTFHGWSQLQDDILFIRLLLEDLSTLNNSRILHCSVFPIEYFFQKLTLSFAMTLEQQYPEIEFTSHIPDSLGTFIGDKIKLEEVFLNLLRNAREAVGQKGTIHMSVHRKNSSLIIRIHDNGCGISPDHLQTLFDPFVTYKPTGTGLGLAISKRIIEAHNGIISVESEEGKGSIFSIHLPI